MSTQTKVTEFLSQSMKSPVSGEVLFKSDDRNAKVYFSSGLISWAFATGQKESFQGILLKEHNLSKEELLSGVQQARKEGKKGLNEILLLLGVDDAATRESIISRQTKSALSALCSWEEVEIIPNLVKDNKKPSEEAKPLSEFIPDIAKDTESSSKANVEKKAEKNKSSGSLDEIFTQLRTEIPGFQAILIVDSASAMPIASKSLVDNLETEIISAYYTDVIRSVHNAFAALEGKGAEPGTPLATFIDELLITGTGNHVFLKLLGEGEYITYILLEKSANPGMAKLVLKKYAATLKNLLG